MSPSLSPFPSHVCCRVRCHTFGAYHVGYQDPLTKHNRYLSCYFYSSIMVMIATASFYWYSLELLGYLHPAYCREYQGTPWFFSLLMSFIAPVDLPHVWFSIYFQAVQQCLLEMYTQRSVPHAWCYPIFQHEPQYFQCHTIVTHQCSSVALLMTRFWDVFHFSRLHVVVMFKMAYLRCCPFKQRHVAYICVVCCSILGCYIAWSQEVLCLVVLGRVVW